MNKKTIIKALKTLINKRTSIPILEYVCLSDNYISVTDLDTHLSIPYESGVNACVPIDQFLSAIDIMENPSFTVTETKDPQDKVITSVEISFNERKIKVTGESSMNFPKSPIENSDTPDFFHVGHIDSEELQYMEEALAFISDDPLRPALTGVYIGKDITSTDAHRLYWKALKNMNEEFIVRPKTIKTMLAFGGAWDVYCGINYYDNEKNNPIIKNKWGALINNQGVLIIFNPIDEKFPNYKAIIPNTQHTASLEIDPVILRKELSNALKFSDKDTSMGVFTLNGCAKLRSFDKEMGHEYEVVFPSDKVKHEGELSIAFNMKFLDDIASTIEKKKTMQFQFWTPTKCAIINGHYLLLPLILKD